MRQTLYFDFETEAIGPRPEAMPPRPVGMAYCIEGVGEAEYLHWGHADSPPEHEDRKAAKDAARLLLEHHFKAGSRLVCHNSRFDIEVACRHFDLPAPDPANVFDTLVLGSLVHPDAPSLSLKPLAELVLGVASTEQDAVRAWLVKNRIVTKKQKTWGAYICHAPAEVVGPYAVGDVTRTQRLFKVLAPKLDAPRLDAMRLEQRLAPILMENEQRGLRVDRIALSSLIQPHLVNTIDRADQLLREKLKAPDLNIDANDDVADALERAKLVPFGFPKTVTGKRSTSKEAIGYAVHDADIRRLFLYRNAVATMLRTFVRPWLDQSKKDGRLHPSWNSVRGDAGGTRTGRLSCTNPNLQNVPKELSVEIPEGFPPLPNLRAVLRPEKGHVWVSADFNSQELRMLAHYAGGELERLYCENPGLDLHAAAAKMISERTGKPVDRKATKIVAFSLLYGAGNATLGQRLGLTAEAAAELREAYFDALPGVRELIQDVKARAAQNKPVRTLGGRLLHAPKSETGEPKDYALVNYLIQGSSADQTKDCIVHWRSRADGQTQFLSTVHDEINISVPADKLVEAVRILRKSMERPLLTVPSRATITAGPSWGKQEPLA
jgi:DNA polymerase-1